MSEQYEDFVDQVGLIQLDNTTAVTIYSSLKDYLIPVEYLSEKPLTGISDGFCCNETKETAVE